MIAGDVFELRMRDLEQALDAAPPEGRIEVHLLCEPRVFGVGDHRAHATVKGEREEFVTLVPVMSRTAQGTDPHLLDQLVVPFINELWGRYARRRIAQ